MNEYQQKIFNQFHTTGLGQTAKSLERHFKHIIETYDWNFNKYLPQNKKAMVLDLGCGLGEFLVWLETKGYKNIIGVDVSQQMLDLAKKQTSAKLQKISSIKDFLANQKEVYDLIVLNDVIEHLSKQEIIEDLEIIRSALKKGGRVLIKTNNLAAVTGARMRYNDFTHEVGLTEYSLAQILLITGFKNVLVRPFSMPLTKFTRYPRYVLQQLCHWCWKSKFWLNFTIVPLIVDEMISATAEK